MSSWEMGVAVGQALERLKLHGHRIESLESKVAEHDRALAWAGRLLLLASLWGAATGVNLEAESIGRQIAEIIKLVSSVR